MIKKLFLLVGGLALAGAGCLSLGGGGVETSGPGGMFLSSNRGDDWQAISALPTPAGVENLNRESIYRLAQDPQDANALYWASRGEGLLYTFDGGYSWQRSVSPINTGFVYSIAVDPNDRCTIVAATASRVYRSTDCNRSWEEIMREDRTEARVSFLLYSKDGATLYLAKANGEVLASDDGGDSWATLATLKSGLERLEFDVTGAVLYAATRSNGLYRSEDGGATWIPLKKQLSGFLGALKYRRMLVHPSRTGVLYWVSDQGILKSVDKGDSWVIVRAVSPPGSVPIYSFAVNPQTDNELYCAVSVNGRSTLYRSFDGGKTWSTKRLPSNQIPAALMVHPEKPEVLYVGFAIPVK